ncbi:MAG: hypothetical protein PHP42_12655 [Bacteroidota bacterium]|nr:hypothetical protein [Bacteroidota bacterium]
MNALIKRHWPLFISIGAYWATVIVLIILSTNVNNGYLIYPLDDTYIHMAVAKNAVLHHVWGVTKFEFTSSTSSPLWTFLLAITYVAFGVNSISPLILNVLFGTLVVLVSYLFIAKYFQDHLRTFIVLLGVVFVTPLPTLTLIGMEHVLHTLLSIFFVFLSITALSTTAKQHQSNFVLLIVVAPLLTSSRYEGMFMVFVVCVLFLVQRKIFYAMAIGIAALLPIILYGIWSISHGWYFFPNSILLKAHIPSYTLKGIIKLVGFDALNAIQQNPHILILLIGSLAILLFQYLWKDPSLEELKHAQLIFVGSLLLHVQFASTGWFYRYEAYLVLLGIVVVSIAANNLFVTKFGWKINNATVPHYTVALLLGFVIVSPFGSRAVHSFIETPQAAQNRFYEHIQPARFIKQYYNNSVVAVNDIGAVAYFTDAKILDVYGLGNIEPYFFKNRKAGYSKQDLYNWAHNNGAQIAFLQFQWTEVRRRIPDEWKMVGQWDIPKNVVFADTKVGIYAVDPSAKEELIQNLKTFTTEIPTNAAWHVE